MCLQVITLAKDEKYFNDYTHCTETAFTLDKIFAPTFCFTIQLSVDII